MTDTSSSRAALKPRAEDVASPDAIIKAMYDTISGPAGPRNWQRERSLYLPGARLIPVGKRIHGESALRVLTLEEWIEDVKAYFEANDFWEMEVMRHTDRFGNFLQAFSTYEARNAPDGPPIARGINSIQLVYNDKRWWIATVMWDNETRENPIPGEFTPYLW